MDIARIESELLPLVGPVSVASATDVNRGRGIFSDVIRIVLHNPPPGIPAEVVLKRPTAGPNGAASMASGGTRREALAYRQLLNDTTISTPRCFASDDQGRFILEDLSHARFVDQLDGATAADSRRVVEALGSFHRGAPAQHRAADLDGSPLETVDPTRFETGFREVMTTWADELSPTTRSAYENLFDRRTQATKALKSLDPPTLTHGDPRIDNIAFVGDQPVFFDWQQVGVQAGVLDLAWFLATSMTASIRNASLPELVAGYAARAERQTETVHGQLRTAVLYPGLMSLLLATRVPESDRSTRFIATSLERIGRTLHDLGSLDGI